MRRLHCFAHTDEKIPPRGRAAPNHGSWSSSRLVTGCDKVLLGAFSTGFWTNGNVWIALDRAPFPSNRLHDRQSAASTALPSQALSTVCPLNPCAHGHLAGYLACPNTALASAVNAIATDRGLNCGEGKRGLNPYTVDLAPSVGMLELHSCNSG
jgi:hypothetical protein